jgi:YVTN family beta-propeller protein
MRSKIRRSVNEICQFFIAALLLGWPASAWSQGVTATISVGTGPEGVAVNTVTNKIYVANLASDNVTIVDGITNSTITVQVGVRPRAVAMNEATNKIYVANAGTCAPLGGSCDPGSVTVIDGATNLTTAVIDPNAISPIALAVNSVTDKIYVANGFSGNVTVIDGATNSTVTVTDPNAITPFAVAVNSVTNKIYVANNNNLGSFSTMTGNVTVIDGATNATTTITDPNAIAPVAVKVNPVTNKIYVANEGNYPAPNHGNVTVIDGATNSFTTVTDPNALAPVWVAVNQTTNKIYVADANDSALTGNGGVTVIDGTTNAISFASAGPNSHILHAVAVDSMTNTIFATSEGCFLEDSCRNPGSVSVFSGATNALPTINFVKTIIDPSAQNPEGVAVNEMNNKIYVANVGSSNVTVIDGGAIPTSHTLSVVLEGSGSGTVTSNPMGINCGTSCNSSFATGTAVILDASPSSGSTFSGWSTNCSGTGACNVTMTSDEFVTATLSAIPPDFSMQPASASLTAQRGTQMTDVITIAPLNGVSFVSTIQLSCTVTGATPTATCALSPTSVTPGANPATSTLTVTVPGLTAQLTWDSHRQFPGTLYAVFLPGLAVIALSLEFGKAKNRRHQLWLSYGLFVAFVALQAGCGGGSGVQPMQPLSYTVTVTATSGAIQHTTSITVAVPQGLGTLSG